MILGGGFAAVETALELARRRKPALEVTLVSPTPSIELRPFAVREPFDGPAPQPKLPPLLRRHGVDWIHGLASAVEPERNRVRADGGGGLEYDYLVVATGAAAEAPRPVGATLGTGEPAMLRTLRGFARRSGSERGLRRAEPQRMPLPLYELALLTARDLTLRGVEGRRLLVVTPQPQPLSVFGPEATAAMDGLLADAGIELRTASYPLAMAPGELEIAPGGGLAVERVVWGPRLLPNAVAGMPTDHQGFVPVDGYGRVEGPDRLYAAGDVASFPIKQGGLAAQQAEATVSRVLAEIDHSIEPHEFRPVLRAMLLTGGKSLFLESRRDLEGRLEEAVSERPLWLPSAKVAGRHLAPLLATTAT